MIKFYCHYDENTYKILQVGGSAACDLKNDNIKTFEIPFDPIGKSIINGDTNADDWQVTNVNGVLQLLKIPKTLGQTERYNTLIEVNNKDEIKRLITIYVTKKKDPSILISKAQNIHKWKVSKDFSVFTDRLKITN